MRHLLVASIALGAGVIAGGQLAVRTPQPGAADAGSEPAAPATASTGAARDAGQLPGSDVGPRDESDKPALAVDRSLVVNPSSFPPGRAEPADAGIVRVVHTVPQNTAVVTGLESQITALRAQIGELEEQQASAQSQLQQLQRVNAQLNAINQQLSDTQAQRAEKEQQAAARQEEVQQAIGGLGAASETLARGSTDVGSALDAADETFTPQARRDLAAARTAIATSNLGEARALLQAAIGDAQAGR
jgi:hypothetical protein